MDLYAWGKTVVFCQIKKPSFSLELCLSRFQMLCKPMPLFVTVIQYNKSCQNCSLCSLETNLLKFCSMSQITQHQILQLLFHFALGTIHTGFFAIFAQVRAESFRVWTWDFFRNKQHRNPFYKEHRVTGMVLLVSFISEMEAYFLQIVAKYRLTTSLMKFSQGPWGHSQN